MLKETFLFFAAITAVTAVSLGQTDEDDVARNQQNDDSNEYVVDTNEGDVSPNQRNGDFNEYYFFTRSIIENIGVPQKLNEDNMEMLRDRNTIVAIHGHGGSYTHAMNYEIARSVLNILKEDVNVIILDWSVFAAVSYANADAVVPSIGRSLADQIALLNLVDVTPNRMHIVGFNLGAHIAGWAGRTLKDRGAPVARITALDPSACSNKLQRDDANYVEVIHTDGGSVLGNGLGEQLGDADFFPNGGISQPGCRNNNCCHNRAWELFAASLGWNSFLANCCTTMSQMKQNSCRGSLHEMGNNRLVKIIGTCDSRIFRVNTGSVFPF